MSRELASKWPFGRKRTVWDDIDLDTTLTLIGGVGLGVGLMYLLDPDRGNRRRAMIRDAATRTVRQTGDAIGATSRDFSHRTRGLVAEVASLFGGDEASDEVLEARARSKMGRVVSHPGSIDVRAEGGRLTLSGPVLADEVDDLLSRVSSVRGVEEVVNRLEVHRQAGDVPGLQGGGERPGERFELMQTNWSPTARVLTAAAGGALMVYCLKRRDALSEGLGTLGLLLFLRGATNLELKRLIGVGVGRRAVEVQKTINVKAPVDVVYGFWADYENFPRFMTNVREVRDQGGGRSHWVVAGPAGVPVEWDAVITEQIPNRVLAWKSVPGSAAANAGVIRFDPNPDGNTRVHIRLSYNPPAGAIGHGVAALFGADPKREMDEDLLRMKTLIEGGSPPHDATRGPESERAAHSS
jgi:uncharacterized membrane protein